MAVEIDANSRTLYLSWSGGLEGGALEAGCCGEDHREGRRR